MMTSLYIALLLCVTLPTVAQTAPAPDSLEQALITEINRMRSAPRLYVDVLDRYKLHMRSFVKDKQEFERALRDCKKRLMKSKPIITLAYAIELQGAAEEHGRDTHLNDITGHVGTDGSKPDTRVLRQGSFRRIAECITYGQRMPDMIVAALLVDHDTPSRAHREFLLSPDFQAIGVSIVPHTTYDRAAIIVLAQP